MAKEESTKKRARIQLMDLVVLVLLVLCVVSLMIRSGKWRIFSENVELDEYRIRFSVSDILASSVDAFVIGDTFTLVSYHDVMGTLENIESVTPAVVYVENGRQEILRVSYPEGTRVDLIGTLEATGTMGEGGFLLGGTLSLSPGVEYRVQSEHLDVVCKIIDIVKR